MTSSQHRPFTSMISSFSIFLFLFSALFSAHIHAEVEIWQLEKLYLNKMEKVKERFDTIVWLSNQSVYRYKDYYIKIWSSDVRRSTNFLKAYSQGVFEDVTCLHAIIFDQYNRCRGYVTQTVENFQPRIPLLSLLKQDNENSRALIDMFHMMREKTLSTGFVYGDIRYDNIGLIDGRCYLYDLDGIIDLSIYKNLEKSYLWNLFPEFYISRDELNQMVEDISEDLT